MTKIKRCVEYDAKSGEWQRRECEFISMFYMDRVVLHSSGEVSYLGRAYVDP